MYQRDPEEDLLPHCIHCDGRHFTRGIYKQSCEEFKEERLKREAEWKSGNWKAAAREGLPWK